MEKRLRTNLALAASVVVLGLIVWLAPQPQQEAPGFSLIDSDKSISDIRVFRDGVLHFSLRKQADGWRLVEPAALPADEFQLNALLEALHAKASRRYSLPDSGAGELGLAKPEWTIKVNGEDLAIGVATALGNNRYVMKGEYVYLVSEVLVYRFTRSPWDYAAKRLLSGNRGIVALTLPDGTRIEREDSGWKITPERQGVTSDELQQLVNGWANATAMRVTPAASVPRDGQVVITLVDGEILRFGVEIRDTEVLLSRDAPAVTYALPPGAVDELLRLPIEPADE